MARLALLLLSTIMCTMLSLMLLDVMMVNDKWSIQEVEHSGNHSDNQGSTVSSLSGLWRICRGQSSCVTLTDPSASERLDESPWVQRLLWLHEKVMVFLPLSLIFIVCGWIYGLLGVLSQSVPLLIFTGCYYFLGGVLTLTGVSVHIRYSHLAFESLAQLYDAQPVHEVRVTFAWSLVLVCISSLFKGLGGALLLRAARLLSGSQHREAPDSMLI